MHCILLIYSSLEPCLTFISPFFVFSLTHSFHLHTFYLFIFFYTWSPSKAISFCPTVLFSLPSRRSLSVCECLSIPHCFYLFIYFLFVHSISDSPKDRASIAENGEVIFSMIIKAKLWILHDFFFLGWKLIWHVSCFVCFCVSSDINVFPGYCVIIGWCLLVALGVAN